MSKRQSVSNFLKSLSEEKQGYHFGDPLRISEDALSVVLPIIRKTSRKRQYALLSEYENGCQVVDTGNIFKFKVKNSPDLTNVFIRAGTIFKGPTQERASVRSEIVFPGQEKEIEVRCVHRSKGISGGSSVTSASVTPYSMETQNYDKGWKPKGQGEYWSNVNAYTCSVKSPTEEKTTGNIGSGILRLTDFAGPSSDDLHSVIENVSSNLDQVLKKVERQKDQAGLALITQVGLQTIEVFDVPQSWEAFHKDAVKRVGQELIAKDKQNVFEYKAEAVKSTVAAALAMDFEQNLIYEHKPSNGEPSWRLFGLTNERFLGEIAELDGKIIHLILNRVS